MDGRALEFVKAVSEESLWAIIEQGKDYARKLENEGVFNNLCQ
jgi:hypothetical protein